MEVARAWDKREGGEGMQGYGATYVSVLNSQLPMAHLSTLARACVWDRIVLIEKDPAATLNNLEGLSEQELVMKANEALERMQEEGGLGPENVRMVGAKKLKNGGIVYEFSNAEVEKWLSRERESSLCG